MQGAVPLSLPKCFYQGDEVSDEVRARNPKSFYHFHFPNLSFHNQHDLLTSLGMLFKIILKKI
jgi:hypothetical protein